MRRSAAGAWLWSAAAAAFAQTGVVDKLDPKTAAYEDRLIDDGALPLDLYDGLSPLGSTEGPPRALRLDGLWSQIRRDSLTETQGGIGIGGYLATPNHGAFMIDGLFTNGDGTSIATLWQRDMPFDGGWRAHNGLGMLNTPAIDLARFQPRIFLPTTPSLGVVTDWRGPGATQITAGVGEPGVYIGAYVPEFRRLGGQLYNLGAQTAIDRQWSAGLQLSGSSDVTSGFQFGPDPTPFSTRSMYAAATRQDATSKYQLNLLESWNSFDSGHRGAWFDGLLRNGRLLQSFGLFYLEPNLVWGNQPVANNAQGGYYRMNYSSLRWLWDGGVDYIAPVDDSRGSTTTFVNGSVRYQFLRNLSGGTGGNVRLAGTNAWQGFVYLEHANPLLTHRAQLSRADDGPRQETLATFNQTWNVPAGSRLNTTFAVGRYRDERGVSSGQFAVAANGGGEIFRNVSLDLNAQWSRWTDESDPTSLTGSVVLTWSILPELRLIATAYRSRATVRRPISITSPLDTLLQPTLLNDSGAFLILRYEMRAGSLGAPLGGPAGAGAGSISGTIFLDGNDSGRLDAGEAGAANVTVLLDGRYPVRTDSQGRFEFPAVASGRHLLTVVPDNLPLPWILPDEGRIEIDVRVRENLVIDIGAQRMR